MRITQVASASLPVPPIKGGAVQLWMDKVARGLAARHAVQVIAPWDPRQAIRETDGALTYSRIRFGKAYKRIFKKILGVDPFGYPERMAILARQFSPELLHLHGGGSTWLPAIRRRLGRAVPTIIHLHNVPDEEMHKWECRDWNGVWFFACSDYLLKHCSAKLGIPADRMWTVRNGVDIGEFQPWQASIERRCAIRAEYGIPPDAVVVLFAGRVAPEKGPQWVAQALAPLMAQHADLWAVFVGDYRSESDRSKEDWYRTWCEIQSALSAVSGRVVFTGFKGTADMPAYMAMGDVFAGPSQGPEAFGMVYAEAMATGLPVIATPMGGVPEVVKPGFGNLVEDVGGLKEALQRLVSSPSLRLEMGNRARQEAVRQYSWDSVIDELEARYAQVLSDAAKAARQ